MRKDTYRAERLARQRANAKRAQQRQTMLIASVLVGAVLLLVLVLAVRWGVTAAAERAADQATESVESGGTTSEPQVDTTPAPNTKPTPSTPKPQSTPTATPPAVEQPEPSAVQPPEPTSTAAVALEQLAALPALPGQSTYYYERDLFGEAWYDYDRNGCDTRNDILNRDLRDIVHKEGTGGCKVLAGTLDDWYSGTAIPFQSGSNTSQLVPIDHLVALSWAWHHGADTWSPELRLEFANDPSNLVATTQAANSIKSDSGPAEWLPDNPGAHCRYVEQFTGVLTDYQLGVSSHDRATMQGVLNGCV